MRSERGFTLVEVTVAAAVLAIVVVGVLGTIALGAKQSALAADTMIASDAARQMAERMASCRFRDIFALYNADANDDPGGAGTAPGANFAVKGLAPRTGDPDGRAGRIAFPTGSSASHLREDVSIPVLGMPRDLDGDGKIDDKNKKGRYVLLPATIHVEWQSTYGEGSLALHVLFADRSGM